MHKHIPKEIVEEYRESLKSEYASRQFHLNNPDFCEKTMDYFEKMGEFAENAATSHDIEAIADTVKECNRRTLEKVDAVKCQVEEQHKDIESLKHNDRRQDARLDKLEHQNINMAIKLDSVDAHTKQIPQLFDLITSMHDTINISLSSKSTHSEKPKPKQPFWDKLPIQAWLAIAAGISGAIVYIITGEIINFGGA